MESKLIAIIGIVAGWVLSALGLAAWIGRLENRVKTCEEDVRGLSEAVTLPQCIERMEAIKATNTLQFQHGAEQFIEIKELIKNSNKEHRESFDRLASMIIKRHD